MRECAKPWDQADGDVCEAIDFLEYYARGAIALEDAPPALLQLPGERNELRYRARGVTAVIAPWNFPLAIALGMTAAALATGNTVLLKPAEQSPGCAGELVRALREAGVPRRRDRAAARRGRRRAPRCVRIPRVATIAFTGLGARRARDPRRRGRARRRAARASLPRVVAEMGGKNCVIVDSDADLDEAVPGIVQSAFAFAGQKCSAASRVLVHEAIADALIERLAGAVERARRRAGRQRSATTVPPVIEPSAQRARRALRGARAAGSGRLARRARGPAGGGLVLRAA